MASKINPRGEPYSSLGVWFSGLSHYVDAEVYNSSSADGIIHARHAVPVASGRVVLNNTTQLPPGTKFLKPTFQLSKDGEWRKIGINFSDVISRPLEGFDTYQAALFSGEPVAEDAPGSYGLEVLVSGRKIEAYTLDENLEPLQNLSKLTSVAIARTGLTRAFGLL